MGVVSAPDSAFYNWVEGSLVQRVHFSFPSQECEAGVGMQLSLSVNMNIIIVQDKMASYQKFWVIEKVSHSTLFYLSHSA